MYQKKVKKAAARRELASSAPTITLDVAAANRFINAALPDLTHQQKQALGQRGNVSTPRGEEGDGGAHDVQEGGMLQGETGVLGVPMLYSIVDCLRQMHIFQHTRGCCTALLKYMHTYTRCPCHHTHTDISSCTHTMTSPLVHTQ